MLPGTHSKWVQAHHNTITTFKTFMTGELFALLAQHSILGKTLDANAPLDEAAFVQGLERARSHDALSHLLFGARALSLFNAVDAAQSASYLSGLLIGTELGAARDFWHNHKTIIIGAPELAALYQVPMQAAGADVTRMDGGQLVLSGLTAARTALQEIS